ncbi:MAG: hypothetical protein ACYTET_08405 [Planctomycetota bacterium]|jgi:hypothetical protein
MSALHFDLNCGAVLLGASVFDWVVNIALIVSGLIILVPFLFMLLARFEKRMIHCFEPCGEREIEPQSDYCSAVNDSAREMDFHDCGCFRHSRGGIYQMHFKAWVSPDFHTLLIVTGGKMMGVAFERMYLHSRTMDGPILVTTDMSGEADLSGLLDTEVLWNCHLDELYDLHRERLAAWDNELEYFEPDDALEEFELIERQRVRVMVNAKLAQYVGYDQNAWRYTWKGGFMMRTRFIKSMKTCDTQAYRFGPEFTRPGQEVRMNNDE